MQQGMPQQVGHQLPRMAPAFGLCSLKGGQYTNGETPKGRDALEGTSAKAVTGGRKSSWGRVWQLQSSWGSIGVDSMVGAK